MKHDDLREVVKELQEAGSEDATSLAAVIDQLENKDHLPANVVEAIRVLDTAERIAAQENDTIVIAARISSLRHELQMKYKKRKMFKATLNEKWHKEAAEAEGDHDIQAGFVPEEKKEE